MPINNFKPFSTAGGANVLTQTEYEALAALSTGWSSGKASSKEINKAVRQATFIAAAVAQFVADKSNQDVLDDGNLAGFVTKLITAMNKTSQPLDATLTALAGLVGAANKLAYFNGTDTAALTDLTQVGRDIIGKTAVADVLTYLGLVDSNGYSGRLVGTPKFITTSGTYTTPPGVKAIIVEVVGGGGGGGGCVAASTGAHTVSGGGGAGGTAKSFIALPLASYTVTIGAGGTAGTTAGSVGGDGGTTSFGSVAVATGGAGGGGGNSGATSSNNVLVASGGNAGKGTTGNISSGSYESASQAIAAFGSNVGSGGGSTPYGTGGTRVGLSVQGQTPGNNATGNGAGGGGAVGYAATTATTAVVGGKGSDGCILVWELY